MKKIRWILVALAVVGYCVNSGLEDEARREAEKAEARAKAAKMEAAVSQMVSRTEAIDDWNLQLGKIKEYRSGPVFTIDLEKLWVRSRPILFRGVINDISTADPSRYTVLVERAERWGFLEREGLQLSLVSSKEIVDSFLEKYPISRSSDSLVFGVASPVAVVAHIHSIRTRKIQHCECSGSQDELYGYVEDEEVKIGDGELIDILYLGDVR